MLVNLITLNIEKNIYNAINNGITNSIPENLYYDDIVNITYDLNGNVSTIKTNIHNINSLASELQTNTEKMLLKSAFNKLHISLGAFSGISILSGFGPKIPISIDNVDYVNCEFVSKFKSEGINQTLHSIYVNVITECGVVIPFKNIKVKKFQQFVLCETVIVGKIPEVYLFSDNLDSLYNFVPVN